MGLYVIGNGNIGKRLVQKPGLVSGIFHRKSKQSDYICDLANPKECLFSKVSGGDVVLLTSALSSPDECEKNPDLSIAINCDAAVEIALRLGDRGAKLIFLSTDAVFGDSGGPYREGDEVCPKGQYGVSKALAEEKMLEFMHVSIVRLSYVVHQADPFTRYLQQCRLIGDPAEVFAEFSRRVIDIDTVCKGISALASSSDFFHKQKIWHFGGSELLSRKNMAEIFNRVTGADIEIREAHPPFGYFSHRAISIDFEPSDISELIGEKIKKLESFAEEEFR